MLYKKDPNFKERIQVFNGDLTELQLGLTDENIKIIHDKIQIVIHAGADVRFNVPLLDLIRSNVRGTKELLDISKGMKRLEMFAYISTAYSNCVRDKIDEKFYESPMDPYFWIKMIDHCKSDKDKEILEVIENHVMNPWPNTYTYSKSLSEKIVKDYSELIPIVVIRPSISKNTNFFLFSISFYWHIILFL